MTLDLRIIAKMIDHSLLHPTMTDQELVEGCKLALRHDVASVCAKPYAVPLAKEILAGSDVKVGTVVGFSHGNSRVEVKLKEAELAIAEGAIDSDLALMRKACIPSVQVKAAGGVRTLDDVLRVRALGVTRVGATATEAILAEAKRRGYQ
jgi:deoxyribose-phosphate aldolase